VLQLLFNIAKVTKFAGPAIIRKKLTRTAQALGDAPKEVKIRHIGNCLKADRDYGKGVAAALGIKLSEIPK
jgi:catalase